MSNLDKEFKKVQIQVYIHIKLRLRMTQLSNNAIILQLRNLLLVIFQEPAQNLISVLSQRWWWTPNARGSMGVFHGCIDHFDRAAVWMFNFCDHISCLHYERVSDRCQLMICML